MEGNFGQTYDSLNQSIHDLDAEFSANIDIKVGDKDMGGMWRVNREKEDSIRETSERPKEEVTGGERGTGGEG